MFRSLFYGISLSVLAVSALAQEPASGPAAEQETEVEVANENPADKNPTPEALPEEPAEEAPKAAVPAEAEKSAGELEGSAELGATVTSGNTDTRSVNGKAEVVYSRARWRHTGKAEALYSSDAGVDTAERYVASYKADFRKTRTTYIFATVRGEVDKFSGYDYRISESIGYGRRFWEGGDKGYFELEAGPGARQSKLDDGTREDHAIFRVAARYRNMWTETTEFSEDLIVETGSDNTFTESVTGIKVRINSALAMKLSVTIKHNSDVPVDKENTDTISSINLVYDF